MCTIRSSAVRSIEDTRLTAPVALIATISIVLPMVFCETHNLTVLREALTESLGYARAGGWKSEVK